MLLLPAENRFLGSLPRLLRNIFWWGGLALLATGCYTYRGSALFQDAEAPANVPADSVADSLRIRPNDVIRLVIVTPDPELNKLWTFQEGLWVSPDGHVKIPLLGEVPVAGLTIPGFEDTLERRLQRFTSRPYVQVQYLSFEVYVMGEVTAPGQKMLLRQKGTVIDALAQSGPISELGDIRNVKVLRSEPDGSVRTFVLDLRSVDALGSEGYALLPGDIVYVPPSRKALVLKNIYSSGQMYVFLQLALLIFSRFL